MNLRQLHMWLREMETINRNAADTYGILADSIENRVALDALPDTIAGGSCDAPARLVREVEPVGVAGAGWGR